MPKNVTLLIHEVDPDLLADQIHNLSQIQQFLLHGTPDRHADEWPEAIEGLLNMLASREEVRP